MVIISCGLGSKLCVSAPGLTSMVTSASSFVIARAKSYDGKFVVTILSLFPSLGASVFFSVSAAFSASVDTAAVVSASLPALFPQANSSAVESNIPPAKIHFFSLILRLLSWKYYSLFCSFFLAQSAHNP